MKLTLADAISSLIDLQHKKAVINHLISYLERFVSSDVAPPEDHITVEGMIEPTIGQAAVLAVQEALALLALQADQELVKLESRSVVETEKEG